ncbi:hypothetical protein, partial [Serratia marcescens]|uniref:hypothetical protein n=1 Tax=Serratia marcescens TaxID=615 RepID=UPI00398E9B6F
DVFAGKKSAQIREILISESAWEEMTCLFAPSLSKAGASAGYAAGNVIKVPMSKVLNPVSKQYEWVPTGVWTITKPAPQNNLPSLSGNVADSAASGWFSDALQNSIKNKENGNVNK